MILILLRHGKSSWKNPNLNDFDRPLGKRGIKELPIVMDHFSNYIIENTKVFCSPSLRTMQTYNIVKDFMPSHETVFLKDLYHNNRLTILPIKNTYQPSGQSVTLQSMAVGTPVLITKTEGFWDKNNFIDKKNFTKAYGKFYL